MFLVNCLARWCRTEAFDPHHLALGERVVHEVNETAVSSHDIISRVELAHVNSDRHEVRYKQFGPVYLEFIEYSETLYIVRKVGLIIARRFSHLKLPAAAMAIASTSFGVAECQEKTELALLKIVEACLRPVVIECAREDNSDGHEFIVLGTTAKKLKALSDAHDGELLDTLSHCKTGIVVDPYLRLACPASKIQECADFVSYATTFKMNKIKQVFAVDESYLTERVLEESRLVYRAIIESGMISTDLDPTYFPKAFAFMRKTKTELMLQAMQRHFSLAGVIWKYNFENRTVSFTGKTKTLQQLSGELSDKGITHTVDKLTRTLFLKNSPVSELIHLEIQMAIGTILPRSPLACITDYVASPFRGLKVT